ncbi:MAG: signal peptidase I [Bacteroidaceae bacterium]|nr:signal peptidase I [Bacteroidaceae bacterium]
MKAWKWLLGLVLVVAAVLIVRFGAVVILVIPNEGHAPTLLTGDRVAVGRWAYGYRLPIARWWGYRRLATRPCERNQWVAYNVPADSAVALPDTSLLCIGQCLAAPGDTVWMGAHGQVSPCCNYAHGQIWPLVVPRRGAAVTVTPWNVSLYAQVIRRHEGRAATVQGDSLCIDGRCVSTYSFRRDYYWMFSGQCDNLNDSRVLGLVPHEALLGRVQGVAYSLDGWRPRWRRTFLAL